MDLIKQTRVRFFGGLENTEEPGSIKDQRIPPQKTQSFKGEKKRGQSWFQRQFSGNMSHDYNSNNAMEHATAVAAAAYAISSLQDSGVSDKKKTSESPERSLTMLKSQKEDKTISMPEPGTESRRFSGEGSMKSSEGTDSKDVKAPQKALAPAPSIKKTPTFADGMTPEKTLAPAPAPSIKKTTTFDDGTMPEKTVAPAPSIKKTPTSADGKTPEKTVAPAPSIKKSPNFAGKQSNSAGSMKPESDAPKPDLPTIKPGSTAPTKGQSSTRPGIGETKADSWEKAEMAKIKDRYEKLNSVVLNWENKKKAAAKRKLNRTESEQVSRRAKALQKYSSEMESIEQIVGEARAQAAERKRKEELKAKEKANKIRTTGKVPKTCFCF